MFAVALREKRLVTLLFVVMSTLILTLALTAQGLLAQQAQELEVEDGVYAGEGEGFRGPLKVEVTVKDGEVVAINVLEHDETPDIADPAFEQLPSRIVEQQNINVDAVSGATGTSEGVISAIEDALGVS